MLLLAPPHSSDQKNQIEEFEGFGEGGNINHPLSRRMEEVGGGGRPPWARCMSVDAMVVDEYIFAPEATQRLPAAGLSPLSQQDTPVSGQDVLPPDRHTRNNKRKMLARLRAEPSVASMTKSVCIAAGRDGQCRGTELSTVCGRVSLLAGDSLIRTFFTDNILRIAACVRSHPRFVELGQRSNNNSMSSDDLCRFLLLSNLPRVWRYACDAWSTRTSDDLDFALLEDVTQCVRDFVMVSYCGSSPPPPPPPPPPTALPPVPPPPPPAPPGGEDASGLKLPELWRV